MVNFFPNGLGPLTQFKTPMRCIVNKIVFGTMPSLPNTACYSVLLSVYLVKNIVGDLPLPNAVLKIANPDSLNDAPCFVLTHSNLKHFVEHINAEPRFGNAFRDHGQDLKELNLTDMVKPDLSDADTAFLITDVELVDSGLVVGQYRVFYTTGNVTVNKNGLLNKFLCSTGKQETIYFTMAIRHYGPDIDADIKELIGITTAPKCSNGRTWVIEQLLRYIDATNNIDFNPVMLGVSDAPAEQDLNDGDDDCAQELPSDEIARVHIPEKHIHAGTDIVRTMAPLTTAMEEVKSVISAEDRAFEQKLVDKGLLAPRITVNDIEKLMTEVTYKCHVVEGTNTTIAVAILPIGEKMFTLDFGWSSSASNANFDAELGKVAAIKDAVTKARNKLWELEGYRLAHSLR